MKKFAIALSMFLVSGGLLPIAMNAQTENTAQTETEQTANTENGKAKRGERMGKDGKKLEMTKEGKKRLASEDKKCDKKASCDKKGTCDKKDKRDFKKGDRKGGKKNPLDGIELNAEQKAKIDQLRQKGKEDLNKVEKEAKAKKDKLREDFDKDIKKILTPEQWTQYEKNRSEAKQSKHPKMERKHGDKSAKKSDHKNGKRDMKKNVNRGDKSENRN